MDVKERKVCNEIAKIRQTTNKELSLVSSKQNKA